ncbi:MAG: thioredoxin-disulfide reductase [Oscillospiraceae bacterium]|nr:thioredoxin-disulfide reductase [Oscillospiraceae bacterium]
MEETIYDVLVIGGGPAGYTAALYAARSGLSVVVLEKLAPGGQMSTTGTVDNYPGFHDGVDGFELGDRMKKGAERFGAKSVFNQAVEVDLTGAVKKVKTRTGELLAKTVVLATGAYPRELGLPEEQPLRGRGVAYCATCDGVMYKDKTVVVSGGGNTAVDDALYLSKLCKKVYLVHRRDELRAPRSRQKVLEDNGVEILWNSKITKIHHGERVNGVELTDTKTGDTRLLPCEGVFVAIGRVPDTALVQGQIELDEGGYVVADESTRTSVPGVFAAGDLRAKVLRQIVTAVADGAAAAHFAEEYLMEQGG